MVAFDAFIFYASCLTLLAGNFSRSLLLSFMVLDTNFSSFKKNQNISLCKILTVSGGYLTRDTCAYTTLCHSSTDQFPCMKLVSRSHLALTSFDCGLQNLHTWTILYPSKDIPWTSTRKHVDPYQNLHSTL